MGALCAVIAIISVIVPFAAGLALLGTVPTALLAYRYRLRVLVAATVAAGVIAFLIAGLGGFMSVIHCVYVGGLTGFVKRKGRGKPTMVVSSLVAGVVFGAVTVGMLMVLTRLRHLILQVTTANVDGMANFLTRLHLDGASDHLKRYFAEGLHYWPWLMLVYYAFGIMTVSMVGWWALSRLLERMRGVPDVHKLDAWDGSWARRARSGRFRCDWTGCVSATRALTKTRCARSPWASGLANMSRSPEPTAPGRPR